MCFGLKVINEEMFVIYCDLIREGINVSSLSPTNGQTINGTRLKAE